MAITKPNLLVTLDIYENVFNAPEPVQISDWDISEYNLTKETKFEKWSQFVQTQLNAVVGGKLASVDYRLDSIKPEIQAHIVNIIGTRLARAFHNDTLLNRDGQVNMSQSGGINYQSSPSVDAKSSIFSFFNGEERLLIEQSGIRTKVIAAVATQQTQLADNQFKSGEYVPDVDLSEFQKVTVTIGGTNMSVNAALDLLQNNKATKAEVANAISLATNLEYDLASNTFTTKTARLKANLVLSNKLPEEYAQAADVDATIAATLETFNLVWSHITRFDNNISNIDSRLRVVENALNEITIIDTTDKAFAGTAAAATVDLKTYYLTPDDATTGSKFTSFTADDNYDVRITNNATNTAQIAHLKPNIATQIAFFDGTATRAFSLVLDQFGILTATRTAAPAEATNLVLDTVEWTGKTSSVSNDINNLLNKRVAKQLHQGTDFASIAQLLTLLADGDLVNIVGVTWSASGIAKLNPGTANKQITIYGTIIDSAAPATPKLYQFANITDTLAIATTSPDFFNFGLINKATVRTKDANGAEISQPLATWADRHDPQTNGLVDKTALGNVEDTLGKPESLTFQNILPGIWKNNIGDIVIRFDANNMAAIPSTRNIFRVDPVNNQPHLYHYNHSAIDENGYPNMRYDETNPTNGVIHLGTFYETTGTSSSLPMTYGWKGK